MLTDIDFYNDLQIKLDDKLSEMELEEMFDQNENTIDEKFHISEQKRARQNYEMFVTYYHSANVKCRRTIFLYMSKHWPSYYDDFLSTKSSSEYMDIVFISKIQNDINKGEQFNDKYIYNYYYNNNFRRSVINIIPEEEWEKHPRPESTSQMSIQNTLIRDAILTCQAFINEYCFSQQSYRETIYGLMKDHSWETGNNKWA